MLEIYAPDGTKTFDSNQSNFSLKGKYVVSPGAPIVTDITSPSSGYPYTFTVPDCIAPFVCLAGGPGVNSLLTLYTAVRSGSDVTYTYISSTNYPVTFYAFDFTYAAVDNPDAVNYGLQTFDENGVMTLDLVQCRLLRVISELVFDSNNSVPEVVVPVGKTYAIGFSEVGSEVRQAVGEQFAVSFGLIGTNASGSIYAGTTLTIFNTFLAEGLTSSSAIVVDVTGY